MEHQNDEDTERARRVGTRVVDSQWLFNNLFVGVLVVDARPADAVATNTILGAVHIPPLEQIDTMDALDAELVSPHREKFTPARRLLREVVIVGDLTPETRRWQIYLQKLLVDEASVASVATMEEGFAAFASKYPFYTTAHQEAPATQDAVSMRRVTYPSEIVDRFLYLGNMWQAKSEQVIRDLGITHIVNATLDLGNVFEGHGVRYHEVKIPDAADADIASHFNATYLFIVSVFAIQPPSKHFRVLVHCTQGISRSATLVIMYLMRANLWSLVRAFNYAHRRRPVIIPNSGFFRALMADERRLFKGRNSLRESEIDALLQGRLEDRDATIDVTMDDPPSSVINAISDGRDANGASRRAPGKPCALM